MKNATYHIYKFSEQTRRIVKGKTPQEIASKLLLIAAVFQISDTVQVVTLGALRGMQDVKIPTFITFIAYWIIGFPISYYLSLYTDYINSFGNIDVDWEINFDLTINKYVSANVGSHFLFDDDIKSKKDTNNDGTFELSGPKIQVKQVLGVGFLYSF